MSRKELFKRLNQLCNYLSDEYCINCGGCCYVAACLAEQLERVNIPFKVIHYNYYSCHYAIKVSDRYLNRDDYRKREISETLDCSSEYLFQIYNKHTWNDTYDVDNNNKVKQAIREVFRKYENSRTRLYNGTFKR